MSNDATAFPLDVLARVRLGEAEAFAAVYDRYSRQLHTYAYRLLGDEAAADVAVRETFIHAWRSVGQLHDDERLEPWLYRIASSRCFSLLRRRRLIHLLPLDLVAPARRATDADLQAEVVERDLVSRALRTLPPGQAACLILRHAEGFACGEIAEILGISPQSVLARLSRARQAFTEAFGRQSRGGRV